jgi:hypothetical protein
MGFLDRPFACPGFWNSISIPSSHALQYRWMVNIDQCAVEVVLVAADELVVGIGNQALVALIAEEVEGVVA